MINALILDLDGTVYLDGNPIKNIIELLNEKHSNGTVIYFLTNNTSVSKTKYVEKLNQLSLSFVTEDQVLSPIDAFLNYAKSKQINTCYYLLPEEVIKYIEHAGGPKMDAIKPEMVLVGFDRELTYQKLQIACELINAGITYSITHIDLACPSEKGPIPDCGSIAKLVESTTSEQWIMHFGKPSEKLGDIILENLDSHNVKPINTVMVGDRYYTDIALGNTIGLKTCHVQTGENIALKKGDPSKYHPTYEYPDICTFIVSEMTKKPS